jgi:hypothetical protein
MATNPKLIKDWIQFLKNNKIVNLKSDPDSGKLHYNRKVTADDVSHFLDISTDHSEDAINNAISMVLTKKGQASAQPQLQKPAPKEPGKDLSTWMHSDMQPGQRPEQPGTDISTQSRKQPNQANKAAGKVKYDPDSVSDIDYKEVPNKPNQPEDPKQLGWKRKPRFKYRHKSGVNEAIEDRPGPTLDENDVEEIFNILSSSKSADNDKEANNKGANNKNDIDRLKNIISRTMTRKQRRAFYNMLKGSSLTEDFIFDSAILRSRSGKDNINLSDLQVAWKESSFSNDTTDLGHILYSFGFDTNEINKVFEQVLGDRDIKESEDLDEAKALSPALSNIADIVKKRGFQDEIIAFMEKEFPDDIKPKEPKEPKEPDQEKPGMFSKAVNFGKKMFRRKPTTEDIRQIFIAILNEDRTIRQRLIKEQDQKLLGRTRK